MDSKLDLLQPRLWPALLILRKGRENYDTRSIVQMAERCLNIAVMRSAEPALLHGFRSPAAPEDVIGWLDAVWSQLNHGPISELRARRRIIADTIVRSTLPSHDQASLFTALDYMHRLAETAHVTQRPSGTVQPEIPATGNLVMQKAYRKLAAFSATDLPIWISGEKGTEVEWMARLIHRIRTQKDLSFQVVRFTEADSGEENKNSERLADFLDADQESTLLAKDMDLAPPNACSALYDHLVSQLGRPQCPRIIVTSTPFYLLKNSYGGTASDLFAFLTPTRIELPPLRARLTDLEALIGLFAKSRGGDDPVKRFTKEAMEVLRRHNWPMNVQELNMVTAFIIQKRPTGRIRPEDLPETVRPRPNADDDLLTELWKISETEGFRVLSVDGRRADMAEFLSERSGGSFVAVDLQRRFNLGRETARRLLKVFMDRKLIEGIRGAKGARITRYRCLVGGTADSVQS
ncbi:hypothetical protein ACFL2Q_01180 [Thermodesulfobacteriota bacterium]